MLTAKQRFEQRVAAAAATAMRTDYDLALLESGNFFRRKLAETHRAHEGEAMRAALATSTTRPAQ